MSFEALRSNIANEKEIIREIVFYNEMIKSARSMNEQKLIAFALNSLQRQFCILNDAIPALVDNISTSSALPPASPAQKRADAKPREDRLVSISYKDHDMQKKGAVIRNADKERFVKELGISEELIKKLKARQKTSAETGRKEVRIRVNVYAKLANRFFSGMTSRLIAKGYFRNISIELKKANIPIIANTYVSMMLLSTVLSFFLCLAALIALLVFYIGTDAALSIIKFSWLVLLIPLLTFFAVYFYPSSEKKAAEKRIDEELPFVAIHMSSIAGSGLEPTNIFKIISQSRENPYTSKEIRKLLNMINFYGMDLVSALRDAARISPNRKLSELFNGLATTISTGGSMTEFLDKRAETLLFDFKLEKEKNTRMAETFMDIYISVAVAAPMMLVLLLVLMGISGISTFLTNPAVMAFAIVMAISLLNIIFLLFLHLKQPKIA
ncbi:MAG TPA: type II secretion system F family protein [Candidatus Nanoarchaeia archaeon]|nr:type II secretion system F family protein [Candidatus Nanoarchaeia archaeon]